MGGLVELMTSLFITGRFSGSYQKSSDTAHPLPYTQQTIFNLQVDAGLHACHPALTVMQYPQCLKWCYSIVGWIEE